MEHCPMLVPQSAGYSSSVLSFELFLCAVLFVAAVAFGLAPGGLAWALLYPKSKSKHAIPGPSGLPVIGMLFAFTGSALTHRVLANLAKCLKSVQLMAFSVGFTRFIVSSCPETAKEILNSSAFADRPVKESAYELLFHRAMGFAPYGEYWRNLRRISATYLFSPKRIASSGESRRVIGLVMEKQIAGLMQSNGEVEIKRVLQFGSLNNVMTSVFGKRYYRFMAEKGNGYAELEAMVSEGYELLGTFNWSDHFPLLGWLDLQGVRRRCRELVSKVNVFVGKIIEEHRLKRAENGCWSVGITDEESSGDFVDVLLDLERESRLGDSDMIAVLWEMIFRGTDTVAILLEWVLARMILHPQIQAKAQQEIDSVMSNNNNNGGESRSVSDSDIPRLPYLQAIVKETFRMHPPGPLLSWARLSVHDAHVAGHVIPAGTTAMVNMWAITHDDKVWPEANEFRPERFMEGEHKDFGIMGSDLRLAPFGSGRRVCPGKAMGLVTVHLWLAQLLQRFNWVASSDSGVDLSESLKLSLEMKQPLVCKAVPRLISSS